jgi:ribosome-associated translation inhibitor RaiA
MQIEVHAGDRIDLTDQCRAYVEYRMFSAASRFEGNGARVSVRLEDAGSAARARYRCVATLDLSAERRVRVSASASRIHAAVDRAAERLAGGAERRMASASESSTGNSESGEPVPSRPDRRAGKETES